MVILINYEWGEVLKHIQPDWLGITVISMVPVYSQDIDLRPQNVCRSKHGDDKALRFDILNKNMSQYKVRYGHDMVELSSCSSRCGRLCDSQAFWWLCTVRRVSLFASLIYSLLQQVLLFWLLFKHVLVIDNHCGLWTSILRTRIPMDYHADKVFVCFPAPPYPFSE